MALGQAPTDAVVCSGAVTVLAVLIQAFVCVVREMPIRSRWIVSQRGRYCATFLLLLAWGLARLMPGLDDAFTFEDLVVLCDDGPFGRTVLLGYWLGGLFPVLSIAAWFCIHHRPSEAAYRVGPMSHVLTADARRGRPRVVLPVDGEDEFGCPTRTWVPLREDDPSSSRPSTHS